jgi:hypothetical protein
MFEPLNKLIINLLTSIDQNASLLFASIIGSLVSVFAREEKSTSSSIASFFSGVFAGWYISQWIIYYIAVPREPLAAVLAIIGRDLVRHIINTGRNNPMFIFDLVDKFRAISNAKPITPEQSSPLVIAPKPDVPLVVDETKKDKDE